MAIESLRLPRKLLLESFAAQLTALGSHRAPGCARFDLDTHSDVRR